MRSSGGSVGVCLDMGPPLRVQKRRQWASGRGFDGNDPTGAPQQVFRQRPPPRPDLDHLFDAVRACCTRNLFQNGPAIEEMLT